MKQRVCNERRHNIKKKTLPNTVSFNWSEANVCATCYVSMVVRCPGKQARVDSSTQTGTNYLVFLICFPLKHDHQLVTAEML